MSDTITFIRRVVAATFVILLMICGFILIGYAIQFFLLIFGAVLFAVLLRAGTNFLKEKVKVPDGVGLSITTFAFIGILAGIIILLIPTVTVQVQEMREEIPAAIENLKTEIEKYEWGRWLTAQFEDGGDIMDEAQIRERAPGLFTSTLGVVSDLFILLVIGIFFAVSPKLYQQGVIVLVSPKFRPRLEAVLEELYFVLKSWLLGKFITMLFVGVFSALGLMILGVPLAIALGFISFLLDFIPTIGPIVASIPAILVAFLQGPVTALYVAILYFVIQSIESYVLVPLIYKKTVAISPVITLGSLVLFGILAGPLGIILATPLVAVIQIMIRDLYIKDYLEHDLDERSENSFEFRMENLSKNNPPGIERN
ncbi:AI-2E family transporter [soil metagenome]